MLVTPMKRTLFAFAVVVALPATAQQTTSPSTVPAPVLEAVTDASGKVLAPWIRSKSCASSSGGRETCQLVIINSATREIARVGDVWATKFAPTGNGSEVKRLETSFDKAKRLASSPKRTAQ
jgi:hypothetical protein